MNLQPTPDRAAELALLVNPDRIRSSLKRLFHNSIAEVLAEIFQNSQRAGAKNVAITITPDGFSIQDDGHGILNGIDGVHTLLKLAESNFDNPTIDDQDPMGIGIVSLLSHDQVEEVTFASNGLLLRIDPNRWWEDSTYYSTWFTRLEESPEPLSGLLIYVRCKAELITKLREALADHSSRFNNVLDGTSPAEGYEGILNITLDGKPVKTSMPQWTHTTYSLVKTTYQGSTLTIGYDHDYYRRSSVRWFGQVIPLPQSHHGFRFHLDVQSGRPVNPLSPTRAGVIEDAAYNNLLTFVENEIFRFLCDRKNQAAIQPVFIDACYSLNKTRALDELPYFTARPFPPLDGDDNSFDNYHTHHGKPAVFTYDAAPLLLQDYVNLVSKDTVTGCDYGLRSFVPLLDNPHELQYGNEARLQIGELYWKVGPKTRDPWFHQAGQYGISYTADIQPESWTEITIEPVFTFSDTSCGDVDYVDFTVGTSKPIDFLQNEVWNAFCPSDDISADSEDTQSDNFRESVEAVIRALMGRCVPRHFSLYDLEQFIRKNEAVAEIKYHYIRGTLKKDGTLRSDAKVTTGVTLTTSTGRKIKLKFY